MCTVTFMPVFSEGFILTSNRDEAPGRNTLSPAVYSANGANLLFPKDELAGGTWIGASDKNRLICLLNGGFVAHERAQSYRMSRGVIVTDLLTAQNAQEAIASLDFTGIEPFTIILVEWSGPPQIYELVWDGAGAHFSEKPWAPQIWSSSLLYSKEVKGKREEWFSNFLFRNMNPSSEELLSFHKTAGDGDTENDLIMDRFFVKTKSISQFSLNGTTTLFRYEDLQTTTITTTTF